MSEISKRVKKLSRPASSVKHLGKTAYSFPKSAADVELKKNLEPKLRQNQKERDESFEAARYVVVK